MLICCENEAAEIRIKMKVRRMCFMWLLAFKC
jgi:hypothetical protein